MYDQFLRNSPLGVASHMLSGRMFDEPESQYEYDQRRDELTKALYDYGVAIAMQTVSFINKGVSV